MPTNSIDRPQIFVNRIHLKGFKSINNVVIDLKIDLNILIGKNGSGKSNFIECIFHALSYPLYNKRVPFDYAKIDFISNDNHYFNLELEKVFKKSAFEDLPEDRIGLTEKFSIDNELVFDNSGDEDNDSQRTFLFNGKKTRYVPNKAALFRRMGYYSFLPLYIRFALPTGLYFVDIPGTLKMDLEESMGILDYINTLKFIDQSLFDVEQYIEHQAEEENHEVTIIKKIISENDLIKQFKIDSELVENVKLYTPIQDLRFNKNMNIYYDEKNIIIDNVRIEFKLNNTWIPWSQLSDGTKRIFYLIAEISYSNGLILVEEPELGIHPHQFNLLMDFIKEQSENKQIIISTHSPKALDHLSAEELNSILIASYDLKKGTQIRHLSSTEIRKAKKYMKEVGFFSDYWMLSDLEE